jgi:uncharacterized membrane protein
MAKNIRLYFITLLTFLALDSVWLVYISPAFYDRYIGHLLAEQPNLVAAGFFYLIFIFGLVYFAVAPGTEARSPRTGALRGAIYGLATYATFDLTSNAVFRDWPALVTIVDLMWGTALSSATSAVAVWLYGKFVKATP